ncbi:MAG TPA: 3-dehydroquinate synthase, partial [Acidimicrobiales bacterium]|nr:3-dehydroquinate synthase [Acidimicrobiales bacterium]
GIGLVFAARLAERLGRIGPDRVAEHEKLVASYDLPVSPPPGLSAGDLLAVMARDKKAAGQGLTFVLDGPAGCQVVPGIDPAIVGEELETWLP